MKRSHSQMLSGIEPTKLPDENDKYLYVVFRYNLGVYSHSLHKISVADLKLSSRRRRHGKGKPKKLPEPILNMPFGHFPAFMAFFSVGSKIYMVGGGDFAYGVEPIASRRCYVFDTCNNLLEDGPPMHHEKLYPIVLGPLNDKFYVLGRNLASSCLEEFDPKTKSWTYLPRLHDLQDESVDPIRKYELADYLVYSYVIVENKLLFKIQKGTFGFDVISRKWYSPNSLGSVVEIPFYGRSVSLDGFWYAFPCTYRSDVWAHSFDSDKGFRVSGELKVRHPSRHLKHQTSKIIVPMGERTLVVVRAGFPDSSHRKCFVTFDTCEFACRSIGKPKHPKVSRKYSTTYIMKDGSLKLLGLSACLDT